MANKEFTFMLIEQVYDGYEYAEPKVLGTFTNIPAVNRYIQTSTDYEMSDGSKPKFISCRQICEFPVGDTHYQLELTSVPHNPYNRIGELADIFADEPTVLALEENPETQPTFLASKKSGYSTHAYFSKDKVELQFWGWAIVLLEDGTWFWYATDGG